MFTANPAMFFPDSQHLVADIRDFGGLPGASGTVNSAAYSNAQTALGSAGGVMYFGPGTYQLNANTLLANIYHVGEGVNATLVQLANGQNADLFSAQVSSINPAAASGTGIKGTLANFGFKDMTIDGNKANQSGTSYPLRFYGYAYRLENVVVRYGLSGGIYSDWNGSGNIASSDNMESSWSNVTVHDCGGENIKFSGPHDTQMKNIRSFNIDGLTHSHLFHVCPNATGLQVSNIHCYGAYGGTTVCGLVETGYCQFSNAEFESTDFYCVVLLQPSTQFYGHCFASTGGGIKLGQDAGETPIVGQILQSAGVTTYSAITNSRIDAVFDSVSGSAGCFKFPTGGAATENFLTARCNLASGVVYSGYADPTNEMHMVQTGLTPDGSTTKGGLQNFTSKANIGYNVQYNYNDAFNVNPYSNRRIELPNGAYIQTYSDAYSTSTSALRFGSGAPSNGTGANGDFYFRVDTPGTVNQRLYVKSAGSWSGIL